MIHGRGVENPSFRQRTAYHAMLLGGIAMLTSALVVIGNKQTLADIELRRAEDMKRSLSQVIHPDMYTNDILKDVRQVKVDNELKDVYVARSNDSVVAVAFEMTGQGYAGPIQVLVGVNSKGELLGARILSHNETPGLGDKIEAAKSRWIFSFDGLSLNNPEESQWKVKKDGGYFDQFTGATITPRAVVKTIKAGMDFFQANKDLLLEQKQAQNPEAKTPNNDTPSNTKETNQSESEPDAPMPAIARQSMTQAPLQAAHLVSSQAVSPQKGEAHG